MMFIFTNDRGNKNYEDAIEILFEENYNRVYKKSFSILLDAELAKDAAQETLLRAFSKMNTLKDKSKFSAWVCAVAVNICNKMLKQKISFRSKNTSIYDNEGNIKNNIEELIDFDIPDKICEDIEIRQELKKYIGELDLQAQQIINMRFYNEFTIEQISEIMNMKEGTVKSKIHRAKQKIAEKLVKSMEMTGVNNNV